jgi:dTDP-4-dehydrorhamnose 3,5-epimerase
VETVRRTGFAVKNAVQAESAVRDVGIDGALFLPLRIIPADGGPVLRFLRPDSPLLPDFSGGFGEIYFSEVEPGAIKAWKRHRRQTQLFAVPCGRVRIALYDGRSGSLTAGNVRERLLGRPDNYGLLRIPPGVWYGFAALGQEPALICNCADIPHDPDEGERLPPTDRAIPYIWRL